MAGSCECGNEPSGSIKYGEFLDLLKTCLTSQGLSTIQPIVLRHSEPLQKEVHTVFTCITSLPPDVRVKDP